MDIIIIGAGAAGLMAAKKLSEAGVSVQILEARDRIGGRIYTIEDEKPSTIVEGGAEFIHGNLEVTLDLLKEAGLEKREIRGDFWQVTNGRWTQENVFFENAELVIKHMKTLEEDLSISDFLNRFFKEDKYVKLREAFTSYIEGYYSGDPKRTSSKAFLSEWMSEDEQQYRPVGGYGKLIHFLADSCKKAGAALNLSTVVKEIKWQKGRVEIMDEAKNCFTASKALITVPLGVWTAMENIRGGIIYSPQLHQKKDAAGKMGFGSVIKILLNFEDIFWEDQLIKNQIKVESKDLHMVLSDMPIPTWWTQSPLHSPLLTGWLSGPKAEAFKNATDDEIISESLHSLSLIFGVDTYYLRKKLKWSKVFNWTNDPFTCGSYSYSTLDTKTARQILAAPIENTLFFAGEALYEGPEMGTVEAALTSGLDAAKNILLA